MSIDDPVWDATVFTNNRERPLDGGIAEGFSPQWSGKPAPKTCFQTSISRFDGTLIEAWAGHKSFKREDHGQHPPPDDPGNPGVDFHGERPINATHRSTTDPEARLYKKSKGSGAMLGYAGRVLMENRNRLAVNGRVTQAGGRAEPQAALAMVERIPGWRRVTLGADKGYDRRKCVRELRDAGSPRASRASQPASSTTASCVIRATR